MDFADELGGLQQVHPLDRRDCGLDAAAAHDGACRDNTLDKPIFADDDLPLRVNFALETTVDPDRAFDPNLALEMHALGQQRDIVVAAKSVFLHAEPPPSIGASLHHFMPDHLGVC